MTDETYTILRAKFPGPGPTSHFAQVFLREPVTIDNATGKVLPEQDSQFANRETRGPAEPAPQPQGFGVTRKLLDIEPIRTAPWLTPELAAQELAISEGKKAPQGFPDA